LITIPPSILPYTRFHSVPPTEAQKFVKFDPITC
jgi:hypothetical protein